MPQAQANPREQWHSVEELLTRWLRERRELLARYTEIVVATDASLALGDLSERQHRLCEVLVDYVSAGHFEVFHELASEAEAFGDGSISLAGELIPRIGDTTEVILAYEEKYGQAAPGGGNLERDLSALGEILENRFVLEDRLIAGLHNRHRGG